MPMCRIVVPGRSGAILFLVGLLASTTFNGCAKSHEVEIRITGTSKTAFVTYDLGGDRGQGLESLPTSHKSSVLHGWVISASAEEQSGQGVLLLEIIVDGGVAKSVATSKDQKKVSASVQMPP